MRGVTVSFLTFEKFIFSGRRRRTFFTTDCGMVRTHPFGCTNQETLFPSKMKSSHVFLAFVIEILGRRNIQKKLEWKRRFYRFQFVKVVRNGCIRERERVKRETHKKDTSLADRTFVAENFPSS